MYELANQFGGKNRENNVSMSKIVKNDKKFPKFAAKIEKQVKSKK